MTDEKDMGSDAARTDPKTADRDREELKKFAEQNIERAMRVDDKDLEHMPATESGNSADNGASPRKGGEDKAAERQSTPGSEAAEPSPE
jgi:hypothetical protein